MPRKVPSGADPVQLSVGNTISERPYHGAFAMSSISRFSNIESGVKRLYLGMLGKNPGAAAKTFAVLRNSRAQEDALFAIAEELDADGQVILKAFWKVYKSLGKRRDQLAHHIWATEPQFPNDVALVEPNALMNVELSTNILKSDGIESADQVIEIQKKMTAAVRLWSLEDFKALDADCSLGTALSISVFMALSASATEQQRADAREVIGGSRMIRDFLPNHLRREPAARSASQSSHIST